MQLLDLTPFGFTPTESSAYRQLVEDGPSSGYALAKRLSIARANAYQALDGLVSKHAAELAAGGPRTYRAIQPQALLTRIARDAATRLDTLEEQMGALVGTSAPGSVRFSGDPEFTAVLMRSAVRQPEVVEFLAPAPILASSTPVWRTRQANGRPTKLWSVGPPPNDFPVPGVVSIDRAQLLARLGEAPIVLVTPEAAILGRVAEAGPEGVWTSERALLIGARGILATAADRA